MLPVAFLAGILTSSRHVRIQRRAVRANSKHTRCRISRITGRYVDQVVPFLHKFVHHCANAWYLNLLCGAQRLRAAIGPVVCPGIAEVARSDAKGGWALGLPRVIWACPKPAHPWMSAQVRGTGCPCLYREGRARGGFSSATVQLPKPEAA